MVLPMHAFESIPLVMSRYWYALENMRGHSRESSIHGIVHERLIAHAVRYHSVPFVGNSFSEKCVRRLLRGGKFCGMSIVDYIEKRRNYMYRYVYT